jgi:ATP-binding cassette subfamily F protein uup
MSYMRDFLFSPEQAKQPVSALSGGERGRLMLARALATPANLLVLDEPTNDLDLETLDLLQEAIADHPGTVILVSHDRDFLDRTVTSVLAAEGNGRWIEYAGGYSDMLAQRGGKPLPGVARAEPQKVQARTAPAAAPAPKRKLGFRERHALAELPKRLAKLNAEVATLRARLGDAGFFTRDPAAFERAADDLRIAEQSLATTEDEWLELEMLREELEG